MRHKIAAGLCALLLAGCAGTTDAPEVATAEPPPNVTVYDVAPPNAQPLGPVSATVCGTKEEATLKVQREAAAKGGNGLTQLVCHDEGMSLTCFASTKCEGVAVNVPPPAPPKMTPAKRKPAPKPAPKPAAKPKQG